MNCKFCNAQLPEDAEFCQECGAKVEDSVKEEIPKCCQCGAELSPHVKFCSQCGAAVTDSVMATDNATEENVDVVSNVNANENPAPRNVMAYIKARPKLFGVIGAVIVVLIFVVTVAGGLLGGDGGSSRIAKTSTSKTSTSKTSTGKTSSSSPVMSDDYYKTLASSALYKEIKQKFTAADAGSTKYKINKTEKQKDYTIVYGKLYLYDKYGKASTGRSDGSGSYIRSFEVKIKNSNNQVTSCTIK